MNKLNIQKIKEQLENNEIDFSKVEIQDRPEEYSNKFVNLVTEEQIIECVKYVDDEGRLNFLDVVADLDYVKAKYVGMDRMNESQISATNTYLIKIGRNGKSISFKFYTSIHNTYEGITINLYNALHCVASDGSWESNTFEDFCDELGFGTDSIEAQKMYKAVKRQKEKILKIFTVYELGDFPQ